MTARRRRVRRAPLVKVNKPRPKPKPKSPQERIIGGGKYGGTYQKLRAQMAPAFEGTQCPIYGCGRIMHDGLPNGHPNKMEFDHIKPAALGGLSVPENLRFICSACNSRRKANENYVADNPGKYPPNYGVVPGYEDW